MEIYDNPNSGNCLGDLFIFVIVSVIVAPILFISTFVCGTLHEIDWLADWNTRKLKERVLNVLPIQNILEKLPVVPVGNAGTIPHHFQLENAFPDASRDCRLVL
jgi:hypothetical protein